MYDYKFSKKLKTFSIALMILGLLGVGYGFMSSHKSFEDVEAILAEESSDGHGGGHAEEAAHAVEANTHDTPATEDTHQAEETHSDSILAEIEFCSLP